MRDLRVRFPKPCDEPWDAMTPSGCDRVCAQCDRVIHDLSNYEVEQAEAILRTDPGSCVRARVDANGVVATKPGRSMRRMVVAAGAGLLAVANPAFAGQEAPAPAPKGAISGRLVHGRGMIEIVATAADGKTYRTVSDKDGHYRFEGLPNGTYDLTTSWCGDDKLTITRITVADAEMTVADQSLGSCEIIIGKLIVEDGSRSG